MKLHALEIRNLRAIQHFQVADLPDFIVVAGANGSGKSCVFDAVRLLKSIYGGYQANEYHQWFGEFAVNLQDPQGLAKLFRDSREPIVIEAVLSFAPSEQQYLRDNVERLALPLVWAQVTGIPVDSYTWSRVSVATQMVQYQAEVNARQAALAVEVRSALQQDRHQIAVRLDPSGEFTVTPSRAVEVAFQSYSPADLGVIEYHSASRSYARQQVGGVNLDIKASENERRQQGLYNSQAKYQNVKTQLASSFVRQIIAEKSGQPPKGEDLNETMKELFKTFFPDKSYDGARPQPYGGLEFPVLLRTGEEHDIDELSSGEKEILYGYLQLKNSTPRNSVLLLDEPELHLNPSLLQGFTDFYYRHLGKAQDNQIWLVTHSDTLLRQAVGNQNYRVYQMVSATTQDAPPNQAVEVVADDDVERVTLSLVGDLASYRPHGKVVILEGVSENGFDENIVRRLFPDFARRVNLVSGGNKQRIRDLYRALEETATQVGMMNRFFVIADKDSAEQRPINANTGDFSWDSYHIENYLMHPASLRAATASLLGTDPFESEDAVVERLHACAEQILNRLVLERLQDSVNRRLVQAIEVKGPPDTDSPARDLIPAIEGSVARLQQIHEALDEATLAEEAETYRAVLARSLDDGTWTKEFPGRLILRRFCHEVHGGGLDAVLYCNSVLDKMVELNVKPDGMKLVIDEIAGR
jgi:AAA domain, putative AbiEii toxin, Type IV TA system